MKNKTKPNTTNKKQKTKNKQTNSLTFISAPTVTVEPIEAVIPDANHPVHAIHVLNVYTNDILPAQHVIDFAQRLALVEASRTVYMQFSVEPRADGATTIAYGNMIGIAATRHADGHTATLKIVRLAGAAHFLTPTTPVERVRKSYTWYRRVRRHRWIEHVPRGLNTAELAQVRAVLLAAFEQQPALLALK